MLRTSAWWLVWGVGLAALGCRAEPEATAPPSKADAGPPAYDAAALRAAWRESVKYRSAKLALANNRASLGVDLQKANRMLEVTEAYRRIPVAQDLAADAKAVEDALTALLATLKVAGTVAVAPPTLGGVPSGEVSTEVGVRYTDEQLMPSHRVTLTLPAGLADGPRVLRALGQAVRLFVVEAVEVTAGRATLRGHVAFFRDVEPVRFVVPRLDPDAIVTAITKAPVPALDAAGQALAEKIRANYAQVDAAREALDEALANEALLAIVQRRFQLYARETDAFNGVTWSGLLTKASGAGDEPR